MPSGKSSGLIWPFRRTMAAVAVVTALAAGGLSWAPQSAAAASAPVRIVSVGAKADAAGRVAVKIKCSAKQTCTGSAAVKVAGISSGKAKFSVRAKKAKTIRVKLTTRQLQAIYDAAGHARRVTATVTASSPAKGSRTKLVRVGVAAPARLTALKTDVLGQGKARVTVACSARQTCKGAIRVSVGGSTSAKTKISVKAKRSKSFDVVLSAKQVKVLKAASGKKLAAKALLATTSPIALSVTKSGGLRMAVAPDPADPEDPADPTDPTDPTDPEHPGEHDMHSHAYMHSWQPTEYDTCTAAEHEAYAVAGPDGKLYPGWHPPVHERADGTTCTFGHEHGDDPRNSDLYVWVMEQYAAEARAAGRVVETIDAAAGEYLDAVLDRKLGLPFGYASERLMEYADAHSGATAVHRHEDDPGHKVFVSNNQKMRDGSNYRITYTDGSESQQPLECDFLMKAHQGSHSGDATKNNTHELVYATSCNDGTKIFATTMSNFGNANELHSSCTRQFTSGQAEPTAVRTAGSNLPDGAGGRRFIPTADCVSKYTTNGTGVYRTSDAGTGTTDDRRGSPASSMNGWWWAGYEQWQSFNSIRDASGKEIARYEPWFGIQNPSRYYARNNAAGTDTEIAFLNDLAWESGNHLAWQPWASQLAASATKIDRRSPGAWFNGAVRDVWIAPAKIDNATGAANVLYLTPWGDGGRAAPFAGSLRAYVATAANASYVLSTAPSATGRHTRTGEGLNRDGSTSAPRVMGFFYDYGTDAQGNSLGVHAPN